MISLANKIAAINKDRVTNQYFINGKFCIITHWKEEVLPYELVTFRVRNGHIFPVIDGSY
jgi:hypothetical protein